MKDDTPKVRRCPACGAPTKYGSKTVTSTYRGHSIEHELPAHWCTKCDESIVGSEGIQVHNRIVAELKARANGTYTPEEVARIRKRLRLSQRRAGELLGGGARAFQRYESGAVAVSQPMANLLKLLDRHPECLRELEAG